jgi:hypothetical protein
VAARKPDTSSTEQIAALSVGRPLYDAGEAVRIREIIDLGKVDLGPKRWWLFDAVMTDSSGGWTETASRRS